MQLLMTDEAPVVDAPLAGADHPEVSCDTSPAPVNGAGSGPGGKKWGPRSPRSRGDFLAGAAHMTLHMTLGHEGGVMELDETAGRSREAS